ncbi:serine/threonine-protein kinase [Nocardioides sp. KR10-350]|uniref:serine/threonine-protein kinase n=1 Tax=Nocardioides cheoyonin TaxID=3156615 RepID=UPI0032B3C565
MTQPPNAATPPGLGSQIGPYRLDRLLATTGMGMVYAGTDTRLHRPVAIKIMLASMAQSEEFLARFDREAAVMARLESPHVIAVYDHGRFEGWPYLVSQYAAGGDLATLIQRYGPLPGPLAADVCAQIADALAAAHAVGIVHRDVKPENVLLRDERLDRPHAYLGDFGVAHTDSSGLTQPGSVAGTWNYLAPERAEGDPGSPAGDLYALGCLFYEALTGRAPYAGSDVEVALAHLQGEVPQLPGDDAFTRGANAVLARVLAKDPAQRPTSAIDVRDQLRLLSDRGTSFAAGPSVRTRGGAGRKTVAAGAAGAVLLAALAGGGVWLATKGDSDQPAAAAATVKEAVSGDVDGDGKGDVLMGMGLEGVDNGNDSYYAKRVDHVLSSTGTGFTKAAVVSGLGKAQLLGDVDGDGKNDLIQVTGSHSTFQVTTDAKGQSAGLLKVPFYDDVLAAFAADVDGDGRDDVGLITIGNGKNRGIGSDTPDDLELHIAVVKSQADGTFAWRTNMYDDLFQGEEFSFSAMVGDFDGNGTDDLVLGTGDAAEYDTLMLSDGDTYDPVDVPAPKTGSALSYNTRLVAANVDGDKATELVIAQSGATLEVFDYEDDAWVKHAVKVTGATEADKSFYGQISATDVDGDGDDDLVFVTYDATAGGRWRPTLVVDLADKDGFTVKHWNAAGISKVDKLDHALGAVAWDR